MVDQFNLRVANQGLTPEDMKAIRAELKGIEGELDGAKFDVVIVSTILLAPTVHVVNMPTVLLSLPPLRLHRRNDSYIVVLSQARRRLTCR